jgi:thioredoxin-like negative regulator of GroEL
MLVFFHGNNQESVNLATVFAYAASSVVGPVFAHVDIEREREVAEAFMKLHNSPGASNKFTLEGYPTIIAYQNTQPVGFYNGARDAQAITDYAYTLACRPGYFEPEQLFKSVHLDQSIEMGGSVQSPSYNSSLQFTAGAPLNRYDPQTGVVVTGSQAALAAGQQEAAARAAAGVPTAGAGLPAGSPMGVPAGSPMGVPAGSPVGVPVSQLAPGTLVPTAAPAQPVGAPIPASSGLGTPVAVG